MEYVMLHGYECYAILCVCVMVHGSVTKFFERSLKLGTLKSLTSVYKNIKVAI